MAGFKQFGLLFWKNWILQKRKPLVTVFEIGLPVIFAAILLIARGFIEPVDYTKPTIYGDFQVNNLPWNLTPPVHQLLPPYHWDIFYSPNVSVVDDVMENFKSNLDVRFSLIKIGKTIGFKDEEDLLVAIRNENTTYSNVLGAVVFNNEFPDPYNLPSNLNYSIRLSPNPRNVLVDAFSESQRWYTGFLYPLYQAAGPREKNETWGGTPGYKAEGFLPIQHAIDNALIQFLGFSTENITTVLQRYPYQTYFQDDFVIFIQTNMPDLIMISLVFVALNIAKNVAYEKEKRLKESMKMMGLSNWVHWLAWFVKYLIYLIITVAIMTLFFTVKVKKVNAAVLNNTDPTVVFVFLLLYSIAVINWCFLVSVCFSKANNAAVAAGLLWFITYLPFWFLVIRYRSATAGVKFGLCVLPNTCMGLGTFIIGLHEGTGEGARWDNIGEPVTVDDNFAFAWAMCMLLFDAFLYGGLTWYVDAVFPGEFGIPKPWYFPFTVRMVKSYWCGMPTTVHVEGQNDPLGKKEYENEDLFEVDPIGLVPGIQFRKLKKMFKEKTAVNEISMDMYEGQVTVLLGHNGAGKTTTMSMLVGLIQPTSGRAYVNGYDIKREIEGVRTSLGLCPQHDVLFDDLTVQEHLEFFAKLKGLEDANEVKNEVNHYIEATGLSDKRNQLSKSLSGGMKRKLSVGIALIANSKVVMLDEPTSGMDPDARRFTWDLLQRHREGRTILLTTHFMDEADLLGDRIAIMSSGQLQCCGSSLFLKKKYGVGYHMVIVKEPVCDVQRMRNIIQTHVPDSELESNVGSEISFILPSESSGKFEELFEELESNKVSLGIASYGASVTTMEEVFLKAGESMDDTLKDKLQNLGPAIIKPNGTSNGNMLAMEEKDLKMNGNHTNGKITESSLIQPTYGAVDANGQASLFQEDTEVEIMESTENLFRDAYDSKQQNTGMTLYGQQFYAMFIKHIVHSYRNLLVGLIQLSIPLIFAALAIIIIKTIPNVGDSPALEISVERYESEIVTQASSGNYTSTALSETLMNCYGNQFKNKESSVFVDINNEIDKPQDMRSYLLDIQKDVESVFYRKNLIAAEFLPDGNDNVYARGFFNNQPLHVPPLALNAIDNAVLKCMANDSYHISTLNFPLPRNLERQAADQSNSFGTGYAVAFAISFGMAFLSGSFSVFLIKESSVKSKHLQFVSGVRLSNFWFSTFLWDMINYMVPCICICILFVACSIEAYVEDGHIWEILLLLYLHGWAVIPVTYLLSFIFDVPATGYVRIVIINLVLGLLPYFILNFLSFEAFDFQEAARICDWIFMLSPPYCLARGFDIFYNNYQIETICSSLGDISRLYCETEEVVYQENYIAWEEGGIGRYLTFLAWEGVVYFAAVFIIDNKLLRKICYSLKSKRNQHKEIIQDASVIKEDEDVAAERQRIDMSPMTNLNQTDALVIKDLRKIYTLRGAKGLVAVNDITVGIPLGECFGLLGVNGAGKTTTFKMLTGDTAISSGNAFLDGFDVKTNIKKVQQHMGYCPQFDALIDQMTGRETLTMFGRLRGMPEKLIPGEVNRLLKALTIEPHADKMTGAYSGGNKRKLSTAIALMGDPPIVFLDEPTTGMDPVARRMLWDTLSQVRESGKCIVLTSHSMEECEALCTRLAIMVNGTFRCLGSTQHLKHRFGEGYTIHAKIDSRNDIQPLKEFIETTFPDCELKDEHQGIIHYHIKRSDKTWANIFGIMEGAKDKFSIEDYSVSQTTLEQVFLNFARAQREDDRVVQ
ncbi:phospholipid-transporting ATPase ABCA3-like [Antedon mediterranea]|uniref:phospholipid-transporting ATPase ABCA3-like n=1 Tax=Antedon mediterranea TaxID=105859 RepID=UPI003AF58D72